MHQFHELVGDGQYDLKLLRQNFGYHRRSAPAAFSSTSLWIRSMTVSEPLRVKPGQPMNMQFALEFFIRQVASNAALPS